MSKYREPLITVPQLHVVSVYQLPGTFFCFVIGGAIKLNAVHDVAVMAHHINAVVLHS